jgi:agmatine/peptidylarginine deiminase
VGDRPPGWDRCSSRTWTAFPGLLTNLIREVAKDARAFVAVRSDDDEARAREQLTAGGVNMANVVFDRVNFNSIWMRDYGPNVVYTRDGDREVVDPAYNRPRPMDDAYPTAFAAARKLPVHAPPLILPGGNLILDGHGVAIMTDMVFDPQHGSDPDLTQQGLEQYFKEYFGCHKVIVIKQMKQDGTGHIDMFCKLLNDDTLIVGQYVNPADGAQDNAQTLDDNAARLAGETNGQGKPFRVVRMPMPAFEPQDEISRTYTNSLIVNDKVLVPVYGLESDETALNVYRTLLPGANVVGFECSDIIQYNGAIHCITHEVNADPLVVEHAAPHQAAADQPVTITAQVRANEAIADGKAALVWRAGSDEFASETLTPDPARRGAWSARLPALPTGTTVQYYIRVEDVRGMYETYPEDASEQLAETLQIGDARVLPRAGLIALSEALGL